jgi:hypothetical protein
MHGKLEAERTVVSEVSSPVRWRKGYMEQFARARQMQQRSKSSLVTILAAVLIGDSLAFVAVPVMIRALFYWMA